MDYCSNEIDIHRIPAGLGYDYAELHYPVKKDQVGNLVGQILTQIESMVLPDKAERATKALLKQMVWRWFDSVMDNSVTSAKGCIAPIKVVDCSCDGVMAGCSDCGDSRGLVRVVRLEKPDVLRGY